MVTPEIHKEAGLVSKAGKELVDHIEGLLKDVRIELQEEYFPARRAAALYDPVGSNGGQYITFQMLQSALSDVDKNLDSVFGIKFETDFLADEENNSFAAGVRQFREGHDGASTQEAIGAQSGAANLDALAEGMVPGFIKLIKNLLPEIPGIDALGDIASPISDYMVTGMPPGEQGADNTADLLVLKNATKDAVEQAKGYLKSSLGIQSAAGKEIQSSPQKIINASIAIAINRSSEFSPARLWHAWAIYPEVKALYEEAKDIFEDRVSERTPGVSFMVDGLVVNSNTTIEQRLKNIREELREYAVLLSACPARGDLCCLVGVLTREDNITTAKSIVKSFRSILDAGKALNQLKGFETPDYTKYFDRLKSKIVSRIIRQFDERYDQVIDQLRRFFDSIGETECISLDALLDLMIRILDGLRARVIKMIKKVAADTQIQRRHARQKTRRLFETLKIGDFHQLLVNVQTELDFADRCSLDEAIRNNRLVRLTEEFKCPDIAFTFHRRGHPIPDGIDPDYPLLNLDPVSIGNFDVPPGIQGAEIPIGSLEELFETCRARRIDALGQIEVAPAQLKRR